MKKASVLAVMVCVIAVVNVALADMNMTWVYIDDSGVPGHEGFTGYMSKYETTNGQYCQYLNAALANGSIAVYDNKVYATSDTSHSQLYFAPYDAVSSWSEIAYASGTFSVRTRDGYSMADHPAVGVSWYGATAFCDYYGYRLPTEWEWQAVADYDGTYTYGCGTSIDSSKANYNGSNPLHLTCNPYTSPVGYYPAYGYGMCDMAGNAFEWTSSSSGSYRVIRGGCWCYDDVVDYWTVSSRYYHYPYDTSYYWGFRVVASEAEPAIEALVDINPDSLNLNSQGKWVTCYVKLPKPYDVSDIDVSSVLLEGLLDVQRSDIQGSVLMVKFDREDLEAYLEVILGVTPPADVDLVVMGELNNGTQFRGDDTIRVISPGGKKK